MITLKNLKIKNNVKLIAQATTFSFLFSFFNPAFALQNDTTPNGDKARWFEVEVILYKHLSDDGLFNESWSTSQKMDLPEKIIDFLQPYEIPEIIELDPLADGSLIRTDEVNVVEKNALETNSLNTPELNTFEPESLESSVYQEQLEDFLTQPLLTDNTLIDEDTIEKELPFQLLDESLHQLTNEAQKIAKSSRYRLLGHYSWRQPVSRKNDATAVRIAGGYDYQENYEYSGDKKLPVYIPEDDEVESFESNSLELMDFLEAENFDEFIPLESSDTDPETNFETDSEMNFKVSSDKTQINENQDHPELENVGTNFQNSEENTEQSLTSNMEISENELQEPQVIIPEPVALPWVPEVDGSIVVYLQRNYLHVDTNLFYRKPDKEEFDIFKFSTQSPKPWSNDSFLAPSSTLDPSQHDTTSTNESFSLKENKPLEWYYDDDFLSQEPEVAFVERLFNYSLKQSRRLKSKELHYFDHPLIGMLIIIRSYEIKDESNLESLE